jgi:hypothetical protein
MYDFDTSEFRQKLFLQHDHPDLPFSTERLPVFSVHGSRPDDHASVQARQPPNGCDARLKRSLDGPSDENTWSFRDDR